MSIVFFWVRCIVVFVSILLLVWEIKVYVYFSIICFVDLYFVFVDKLFKGIWDICEF